MVKISEKGILEIIQNVLELEEKNLTIDSSAKDIKEWDSLGHLGILVALDEVFDGKIGEIDEMATADSVRKILKILKGNSLI